MSNVDRKQKNKPDNEELSEFILEMKNLVSNLQHKGGSNPQAIRDMADQGGITLGYLKSQKREKNPSFSNVVWKDVVPKFGLDPGKNYYQLDKFSFPVTSLPPSFHRNVMAWSGKWLDVYQERGVQKKEAARVRLMDAWHVLVCALFNGRLVDRPEEPMLDTPETSGGFVEHEIYMADGILLLVIELKLAYIDEMNAMAQVLLELDSAFKMNSDREFNPQPPVYAILSDLRDFCFLRYDGHKFTRSDDIFVYQDSRSRFLAGMRRISDQLFSILLEGYIGMLDAITRRSTMRGLSGDFSEHNSSQVGTRRETPNAPETRRLSLEKWSLALTNARQAQDILAGSKCESLEYWEDAGNRGLERLNKSISLQSKVGSVTDWDATTLDNEIELVLLSALFEP